MLATAVTLIVVFVPISFLGGQVGRPFSELGLVMAAAVVISTFVALSMCPMIASRVLKDATGGFHHRAYLPIIAASGLLDESVAVPWWNGMSLRMEV